MTEAVKITVTLEPDLGDFVRDQVENGSFASPSDYVEDLVRRTLERDQARKKLEAELQKGIDDIEAGRVMSLEEAFDSVYDELGWDRPVQ
ncbi:ribbon-helix-helix domain-containing protein [Neorhizobium alkalisoli]|uniref:Antitoxin ParD1/3/4 n=1 Tax=Neorhizobium alkalisoli TaxID=528178 RepID=A0A561QJ65_9HYPH|nr:type II toxin-antitoxin system ParD family antitoxin [Neorhizobium alkalisoli]TWF50386.1 antitoxin ParD1/3/4 [Neorhizobium alkalisoli]